jgi:hypothetical protein
MALDNAQFPSELSITDPPGTDPLSEGDDQIRTAKRALFQGFEFVDKAVTITADQMNLMAIKNEANVFTADQTIRATTFFDRNTDTTVRAASWSTAGFAVWEFRLETVTNNNDFRLRHLDGAGGLLNNPWICKGVTGVMEFVSGTAALPQLAWQSTPDAGLFRLPAGTGFSAGGVQRFAVEVSLITAQTAFLAQSTLTVDGQCVINAPTDVVNDIRYQRALVNRWQLRQNNDAAGNDWEVRRFNDAGVAQGSPLKFNRATGHWFITKSDWPVADTGTTGELFLSGGQFLAASA